MTLVGRPSRVMTNRSIAPAPDSGTGLSLSGPAMHKTAPDGWTFDNNTWQGVRTMDASIGTWTTPDAYAGDVHDPMSQKPFMWNRNNPYSYADPTGYDALLIVNPNGAPLVGHISIAIYDPQTGKGTWYSQGPQNDLNVSDREVIQRKPIDNIQKFYSQALTAGDVVHHITQSSESDAKERAYADKRYDDQGNARYNAISNNCAEFVSDTLAAGSQGGLSMVPNLNADELKGGRGVRGSSLHVLLTICFCLAYLAAAGALEAFIASPSASGAVNRGAPVIFMLLVLIPTIALAMRKVHTGTIIAYSYCVAFALVVAFSIARLGAGSFSVVNSLAWALITGTLLLVFTLPVAVLLGRRKRTN